MRDKPRRSAHSVGNKTPIKGARAFGRFPDSVTFSETLSWKAKLVYAYRTTFVGSFRLLPYGQYGVTGLFRRGLGKNSAQAAIAEFRRYISETQPRNEQRQFQAHSDMIAAPRRDYSIVQREWFDGRLSAGAAAVLIITNAIARRFGHAYVHEITSHLPFSRRLLERHLRELRRNRLLHEQGDNCFRVRITENIRQKPGNGTEKRATGIRAAY